MRRSKSNSSIVSDIIMIIILIPIILFATQCSMQTAEDAINDKVHQMNGEVYQVERAAWDLGPFPWAGKMPVYRFVYKVNNEAKIGWVQLGLFNTDWNFEYNK